MFLKNIILIVVLLITYVVPASTFNSFGKLGENYISPNRDLMTHAVVKEFPEECSPLWNVKVDNQKVGLYNDRNFWGGFVHFGSFEFRNGRTTTITITYHKKLRSFEILPVHRLSLKSVKRIGNNSISITLNKADQNITVVPNGETKGHVLHLFCNSIDEKAPKVKWQSGYHVDEHARLVWFGPGWHNLKDLTGSSSMSVKNGWKVYLAAGAVVYGSIQMNGVDKGTSLCGRGMLYNDDSCRAVLFSADWCKGADIEGVLLHGHRSQCWQTVINHSQNIEFKHVKILSTRYASTDGLDVVNCNNCIFLNTFIRANDDAIAIKGMDSRKPSECPPCYNLTFCGMQLWNDCNCAIGIGAESHAAYYENIKFLNSDVLFSYDDPDYHTVLDERAALTINCLHGTYYRKILYKNLDVYHCERLIAAGFQPDFWFGALKGDQSQPGGMSEITYHNVRSLSDSGSAIANKIRLYGWDGSDGTLKKYIDGVDFYNIIINGHRLTSLSDSAFSETDFNYVKNIKVE